MPLAISTLVLAAFGRAGGGLLDIYIPTVVLFVFLLSLYFLCLCNDEIKYEHAHNRHTGGGGVLLICNF